MELIILTHRLKALNNNFLTFCSCSIPYIRKRTFSTPINTVLLMFADENFHYIIQNRFGCMFLVMRGKLSYMSGN